jgi:hypothetical protein
MFCPKCGQETHSETSSFCSRCGYLLTGTAELFQFGGIMPNKPSKSSPRARGVKQGAFILLFGILLFPLLGLISGILFRQPPIAAAIVLFLSFAAGLLRIAYALMFEQSHLSTIPAPAESSNASLRITAPQDPAALPPQQTLPADYYVTPKTGRWLDTNDLEPGSVTEGTTRLLENESDLPK